MPRPRDDAAGLTIHGHRSLEAAAINRSRKLLKLAAIKTTVMISQQKLTVGKW